VLRVAVYSNVGLSCKNYEDIEHPKSLKLHLVTPLSFEPPIATERGA